METNKTLIVYRYELKYYISAKQYILLKELLSSLLSSDTHNDKCGYFIRSLYFDSMYNDSYIDKLCGIEERKKYRIRIYGFDPSDNAKFEIKNRIGKYTFKESLSISSDEVDELCNLNYSVLLDKTDNTAKKLFVDLTKEVMVPKIIIDYDREAYIFPLNDIRITFDKNVRATYSSEIYNPNLPTIGILQPNEIILEVKYNDFLPQWICDFLSTSDAVNTSISKYCLAREAIY